MQYRGIIVEKTMFVIDRIITIFSRTTGLTDEQSQIVLLIIIGYIIGVIIFIKIHKRFLRKKIQAMKDCIFAYDEIIYLIAKEEYNTPKDTSNSPIQKLFQAKNKDYIKNHTIIIEAIRTFEAETKQIIFTPEMEKKILKLRKKTAFYNTVQMVFGSIISLATAGLYLLVW